MELSRLLSGSIGSRFRQNFVRVARANLLALSLPILATPIMTRLFTPSDYGALAIFVAALALMLAIGTWRFDWVMPNARSVGMAASLFALGSLVLMVVCVVLFLAIALLDHSVLASTPLAPLGNLLFLLPLALAGAGCRQMLSAWYVRHGDLTPVSRATIIQSLTNVAAGLSAGVAGLGALGLIGASVLAAWAGLGTLFRFSGRALLAALRRVSRQSVGAAVIRHGRNASWSTLVSVVNTASLHAPVILLAAYFLPREVGWYALMHRLVGAPMAAFTSALGQSFWSQASEFARERNFQALSHIYLRTTARLAMACIPLVAVCLAAPFFVGPLLGREQWGGAGYVLLAMMPLFVGHVLFSPTNHLVVLNMQHMQLLVDIVRLVLVFGSVSVAYYMELGFVAAVAMASAASLIGHFTLFLVHLRMHRQYDRH